MSSSQGLDAIKLRNVAIKELPVDESKRPETRKVSGACFSLIDMTPVENPKLVASSQSAFRLLDVDLSVVDETELAEYFSGNKLLPGSTSASHCYCGHQFGYFSGQLGDGTVAYIGDMENQNGETWELQLKGIGKTPYSRAGDGRKVLRSSIREFLCSEAMHFLQIPTTRAGSVVDSDSLVTRDMFYDGRPRREHCAVVLRIAPTFLRFGSFEIFKPLDQTTGKPGSSTGNIELLKKMLKYSIEGFYPQVAAENSEAGFDQYLNFYKQVCIKTAQLVAKWQCVGFCHGVLNTDNMSILGLTIDYGPYGFLDYYDPDFICNTTDENGRYSYKNQPDICKWNLKKFAEALQLVLSLDASLPVLDEVYDVEFERSYLDGMRRKLGLCEKNLPEDEELVKKFLATMQETFSDFTNTFRSLNNLDLPGTSTFDESLELTLQEILKCCPTFENTKEYSKPSMPVEQLEAFQKIVEQNSGLLSLFGGGGTIKNELNKLQKFKEIEKLSEPQHRSAITGKWTNWLKLYEERLKKEVVESKNIQELNAKRKKVMNSSNPRFILRNYIAQNAIEEAEKGNYLEVRNVLKRIERPFDDESKKTSENYPMFGFHNVLYDAITPASAMGLRLS